MWCGKSERVNGGMGVVFSQTGRRCIRFANCETLRLAPAE